MDLSKQDPTGRFSGLAQLYARSRPDYPPAAIDFLVQRCGLTPGATVIDVGCGTGISTRLLAARGLRLIGIEPNAEMRRQAEAVPTDSSVGALDYRDGRAEATGLPEARADAVVAAQAFHWFETEAALREFYRILKSAGWVVLLWNERHEADAFTAAYGEVIRATVEAAALEQERHRAGDSLLTCPLFGDADCSTFPHQQPLDEEALLGRALSVSYAPSEPEQRAHYRRDMRAVFARFAREGQVVMRYRTTVYSARKT